MNCEVKYCKSQEIINISPSSPLFNSVNNERSKQTQSFTYFDFDFFVNSSNDLLIINKSYGNLCLNLSDFILRIYPSDLYDQYNTFKDELALDFVTKLSRLFRSGKLYVEFVVTDERLGVFLYSNYLYRPNDSGFLDVTNHFYITRLINNTFYNYSILFDRIIPSDEMIQSETGDLYIKMIGKVVDYYSNNYKLFSVNNYLV